MELKEVKEDSNNLIISEELLQIIKNSKKKKRVAIFGGSFSPPTIGHFDVIHIIISEFICY